MLTWFRGAGCPAVLPVAFSVTAVVVSIQFEPLYGIRRTSAGEPCLLPGCDELDLGFVPWISYGVTLFAPWLVVLAVAKHTAVLIVGVITVVTFAALTVPDLATAQRSVAVVFTTAISALLAAVCSGAAGRRVCV